jgi:hypothetical protein
VPLLFKPRRRYPVFEPDNDRIAFDVGADQAQRMLDYGQARLLQSGRCLRLLDLVDPVSGRPTLTSRGGVLAAIGRSQVYTTANDRGSVNGFKFISPRDLPLFRHAVVSNLKLAVVILAIIAA